MKYWNRLGSYPIIGPLIDRLYLRGRAREHADNAIRGMKRATEEHRVLSLAEQMEKRKRDHPGYERPIP